jgi:hypothetical protein
VGEVNKCNIKRKPQCTDWYALWFFTNEPNLLYALTNDFLDDQLVAEYTSETDHSGRSSGNDVAMAVGNSRLNTKPVEVVGTASDIKARLSGVVMPVSFSSSCNSSEAMTMSTIFGDK